MAAVQPMVIDFDPLTVIIYIVVMIVIGYVALQLWTRTTKTTPLMEKRGIMKQIFNFNRLPTVPTIRIVSRGDLACLELGKRARLRDNSLKDSIDSKGWDITSTPIPIIDGKTIELGYITHPAGCTLELKPRVRAIRADADGKPVYDLVPSVDDHGKEIRNADNMPVLVKRPQYIEANFEGVIGTQSDLDDFNESTEREVSRAWIVPLLVGIIAGVIFFAPLFAWLMSFAAGGGK